MLERKQPGCTVLESSREPPSLPHHSHGHKREFPPSASSQIGRGASEQGAQLPAAKLLNSHRERLLKGHGAIVSVLDGWIDRQGHKYARYICTCIHAYRWGMDDACRVNGEGGDICMYRERERERENCLSCHDSWFFNLKGAVKENCPYIQSTATCGW
jgi:hypothetical protein